MVRKARFSGIARVGLTLSLLAMSMACPSSTMPASAQDPSFSTENCGRWNVGIDLFSKRVYGEPGSQQSLQCDYRPDDVTDPSADLNLRHFPDKGEASTEYAERRDVHAAAIARIPGIEGLSILNTIQSADLTAYLATGIDRNTGDRFWYSHGVLIRYGQYVAEWETSTVASEEEGRTLHSRAVDETEALIDWLAQAQTLKLAHFHPFEETIPSGYAGGDIVASLWQGGEPWFNDDVDVYYFRDLYAAKNCDPGILTFPASDEFGSEHQINGLSNDYLVGTTNALGTARANYLDGRINYQRLSEELASKGECRIPITAVVFEHLEDPEREPSIAIRGEIDLVFKGVARIVMVNTTDPRDHPEGQVIVERGGIQTTVQTDMLKKWDPDTSYRGYNLYDGDTLILSRLDTVDIQWLAGSYMKLMPNQEYMKRNDLSQVQATVGAKDLGWGSYIDSWIGWDNFQVTVGTAGFLAGVYSIKKGSTALSVLGAVLGVPAVVFGGWNVTRGLFSPILMTHESEILVDFEDEGPILYTAEGKATLYDPFDGSRVEVRTGEKMHITPEGNLGTPESFDVADLSPEMATLLSMVREAAGSESLAEEDAAPAESGDPSAEAETGGDSESGLADYAGYCCLPVLTGIALLAIVLIRRRRKRRQTLSQVSEVSEPDETTGVVIASSAAITDLPPAPLPAETATGQTQYCQQCGMPVVAGAAFCGQCGAPIAPPPAPMTRYCPNCGVMCEPGLRFCVNCGARLPADPASI